MTAFQRAIEAAYRARKLTRTHVHVLYAVARLVAEHPSHKRLAAVSGASVSTVRRALARAHALGLLSWTRRVVAGIGWRAMVSNAYRLCGGQIQYSSTFSSAFRLNTSGTAIGLTDDVMAARDALADVARRMEARLSARQT